MKKFFLVLFALLLVGCQKDVAPPLVEEIIPIDEEPIHNVKLKTYNNTLPHLIRTSVEMDDERYGTYKIEMYDTNYEPAWSYLWRDLNVEKGSLEGNYLIHENYLIVNVQGAISVHDLATGEFHWELETDGIGSQFDVNQDVLYILGYEEDYLTGVSLITGEVVLRIADEGYLEANAVAVRDNELIAYFHTNRVTRNALAFDLEGKFIKKFAYMEKENPPVVWDVVESSDESEEVFNLIDGNLKSAYSESVKGYGEKEWVEITRILPTSVSKLTIVNGDQSSEKAYQENAKLKEVVLSVGDGKSFTYRFETFEYGYLDEIYFVKPIIADYILLTIVEAEPGELYKNTSFSEIRTE